MGLPQRSTEAGGISALIFSSPSSPQLHWIAQILLCALRHHTQLSQKDTSATDNPEHYQHSYAVTPCLTTTELMMQQQLVFPVLLPFLLVFSPQAWGGHKGSAHRDHTGKQAVKGGNGGSSVRDIAGSSTPRAYRHLLEQAAQGGGRVTVPAGVQEMWGCSTEGHD